MSIEIPTLTHSIANYINIGICLTILAFRPFRGKKWYFVAWTILVITSVAVFYAPLSKPSTGDYFPPELIIPNAIFYGPYFLYILLPSMPIILLSFSYPKLEKRGRMELVFVILPGFLALSSWIGPIIHRTYIDRTNPPSILVRYDSPNGPLASDLKFIEDKRSTNIFCPDSSGRIIYQGRSSFNLGFCALILVNDPFETEFKIFTGEKSDEHYLVVERRGFPGGDKILGSSVTNKTIYQIPKVFPFRMTLVVTHPDSNGFFPEDHDFVTMLKNNPRLLLRSSFRGISNALLLQHHDTVNQISDTNVRNGIIDIALRQLESIDNALDEYWQYHRHELSKSEKNEIIVFVNNLRRYVDLPEIAFNDDYKHDVEQFQALRVAVKNVYGRWRTISSSSQQKDKL
jgi:hypothetical protein